MRTPEAEYDFMERLAEIAKTEIIYPDDVCVIGPEAAAVIVGAEIIANAVKEAAPSSEDTALLRKAANRVVTFETDGERARREIREALNSFDAIVRDQQKLAQSPQTGQEIPEPEGTGQG